ncbi:FAD-dependent oxidoreductase [Solirubrobacter ginsenosidimutans]|uniref:FAD-dependent oxidoreductase n=1 Tax=Solirubrobacter ginsenosidimutans TaxID=490573 RepID=A0A9X3MP27_9ACTN|nr:FAD-dependent oxidoreductase [Solirubrobacter ginsenosidimutans]MDA0159685.1 FAD-dependent oxidoreductase [Solirubrobacter ginsenosidimutans]
MKIAIVGAGISGLATAHLLQQRHEITVFEAGATAGGHANTVRVDTEDATHHVDTGFIVFNDRNYPNFERLLSRLGVASQPSDMSFGVSDGGDFEYNGSSPNGLFAKRAHLVTPWFHRMMADLVRFNGHAKTLLAQGGEGPSLGHWLDAGGYSRAFVERLIVPQASAVWSADPRQMWTFPARFLVEFFANHGMLGFAKRPQWKTVVGGSRTYVDAITRPFAARMRLDTPVTAIERDGDGVSITPRGGQAERFDEVVLATHSDQALRMLGAEATDREHEILGAIPYQPNEAVLHTDRALLPRRRRAWASWNYHLLPEPTGLTTVTYHMNRLQALSADREFCVTLNRAEAIDPAKVLRTIQYAHPVFTPEGAVAQKRHHEISGRNRTHFAGAYWHWGFHEDGVASAVKVAERFGARL